MFKLLIPRNKFSWLIIILLLYAFVIYDQQYAPPEDPKETEQDYKVVAKEKAASFIEKPGRAIIEKFRETPKGKAIFDALMEQSIQEQYGGNKLTDVASKDSKDLLMFDTQKGTGSPALCGSTVTIAAEFYLASQLNFNSIPKDPGLTLTIGDDKLLPGLEQGLIGLRKDGKRKIIIPANLAYDSEGFNSNFIPKGETITVDVTLLDIADPVADIPNLDIITTELVTGIGDLVTCGKKVKISYRLGYQQDDNIKLTDPQIIHFVLGQGQVPIGLEQGIIGMRSGGKRGIVVEPALQRTTHPDDPPLIPQTADFPLEPMVTFEVSVLSVQDADDQTGQ